MPNVIPPEDINEIFGDTERHPTDHLAIARTVDESVNVMHSVHCRETQNIATCDFSLALDEGIEGENWEDWMPVQDQVVTVVVRDGLLFPKV